MEAVGVVGVVVVIEQCCHDSQITIGYSHARFFHRRLNLTTYIRCQAQRLYEISASTSAELSLRESLHIAYFSHSKGEYLNIYYLRWCINPLLSITVTLYFGHHQVHTVSEGQGSGCFVSTST